MQTNNVELKKLVYLYIINYAKTQPDLAILAVNTFVKVRACLVPYFYPPISSWQDSQNRNPLVRALAIRTMGCIRCFFTEHLSHETNSLSVLTEWTKSQSTC